MQLRWILAFALSGVAIGQTTAVTAVITDPDSQTWNNGTWSATLLSSGPPFINGVPVTQTSASGVMDGGGTITTTIADNSRITPGGSQWRFTICPLATGSCSTVLVSTAGASQNLSSTLSAGVTAPRFAAAFGAHGYLDVEVSPAPLPGATYFNVTSVVTRVWTGSAWASITGGGGGSGTVLSFSASGYPSYLGTTSVTSPTLNPNLVFTPISTAAQNGFLAGPSTGGPGVLSIRSITAGDLPLGTGSAPGALQCGSGTSCSAGIISSTGSGIGYPLGTGVAIVNSGASWGTTVPLAGSGTNVVTGPGSSVSLDVPEFIGTTGQIQDSTIPFSNLIRTAPNSGQTISNVFNNYFSVNYSQHRIWVDGFPSSCTVGGTAYTTQADCAYFSALTVAGTTGNSVTLMFGALNGYNKCAEWTQLLSSFATVNIQGAGQNATFIRQSCSTPTLPMITKTGTNTAYFEINDVTFDANNNAGSCIDYLAGIQAGGKIHHVNCQNVLPTATSGLNHMMQFGNGTSQFGEDMDFDTIELSPHFANPTYAQLTPVMSGTSLASVTVTTTGSYGSLASTYGVAIINDPHNFCSVLPVLGTPTFSGVNLATVPVTSGGTCSAAPDVAVILQEPITYGIVSYTSDSTIVHILPFGEQTGMLTFGANTYYEHIHCVTTQVCIEIEGGGSYDATELDTISSIGFKIDATSATAKGISFTHTSAVTTVGGTNLPGSVVWQFPNTSYNARIMATNQLCPGGASTDYQEFTVAGTGVVVPGGTNWPTAVTVLGNGTDCTHFATGSTNDYDASLIVGKLTVVGTGIPIASGTTSNSDLNGKITLSSGAGSYSFTATYTNAPTCVASDTTALDPVKAATSTTALTLTGTGSDVIAYVCIGQQ